MPRVRVPYTVDGNRLSMAQLRWPPYCVCCGLPAPTSAVKVKHAARYQYRRDAGPAYTTTSESDYYLGWDVPCCAGCLAHHKKAHNPVTWVGLAVVAIAVDFGVGFGLFSMGLSEDTVATVGFAAFVGLSMAAAYFGARQFGVMRLNQAKAMMTPRCSCPGPVVSPSSDMDNIYFDIPNAGFASSFASMNGLG